MSRCVRGSARASTGPYISWTQSTVLTRGSTASSPAVVASSSSATSTSCSMTSSAMADSSGLGGMRSAAGSSVAAMTAAWSPKAWMTA